jgi:molybdopterin converting factor subunit 1
VRVTVRFFARLKDIVGSAELAREVPPGATIAVLWRQLATEFPALAAYERSISSAVNADYARMADEVHEGDEIAFLPPVSGGWSAGSGRLDRFEAPCLTS